MTQLLYFFDECYACKNDWMARCGEFHPLELAFLYLDLSYAQQDYLWATALAF
jgi:hypothetical protein